METSSIRSLLDAHECYVSYKSQSGCTRLVIPFGLLQCGICCAALDMYAAFLLDGIYCIGNSVWVCH